MLQGGSLGLLVAYLTMLSIYKLSNVDDRIIDECVAVGGMKTGRET